MPLYMTSYYTEILKKYYCFLSYSDQEVLTPDST